MIGAGRIGYVHALAISMLSNVKIKNVYDMNTDAANRIASEFGANAVASESEALNDPDVCGVIICSPSSTHCRLILEAMELNKHVFCEKPLSLNRQEAEACVTSLEGKDIICSLGFNRRYDPSFHALKNRLDQGEVGSVETVHLTSRDPALPSFEYLSTSGGIFHDMMIHDFDMGRWLLGEEPTSIFATGSRLVDPKLESINDYDTATVVMRSDSGKLCTILNNRRAIYGYDQRIEVLGSKGLLQADNKLPTTVRILSEHAVSEDNPEYFFLERYKEAYQLEISNFIECIEGKSSPLSSPRDGLMALRLADAALKSSQSGKYEPIL